ncbi:DUF3408 domain-containing protein [Parabacteroides distasonis]|uniref:DUF3408 domain-containing protein n=1 Tax=Parabacteroides distasonis TaxID=823 RepID=UPI001D127DE1|nr:DUF3408 domain-containing protein [Parabacteroides distasonis]MCC2779699.1 DUF3408 domain-containing protein [Parabacteroides distasonis]MCQ5181537.1 DUF3408 domain-containing protein [Parabacteroides distasonis]WMI44619.1 DUF3408 domain-containing protein [Parabacteroides distasonis]
MATRNTNTPNKTNKRESTFDADKFLDSYEEGCRKVDALLYAARTGKDIVPPPEPPKKKRTVKKSPTDDIDISTIDFNIIRADDTSGSKRRANLFKLPEADADDLAENDDKAVVATETAVTATTDKSATTVEVTETIESSTMAKTVTPVTTTITNEADIATEADKGTAVNEQSEKSPKTSRVSGRMRRASRDEFCGTYTRKVDTKGGSPITIAPDILKMAHVICAKSGNYKSCPTYVINNILRAVFEDMADEIKSWPLPE